MSDEMIEVFSSAQTSAHTTELRYDRKKVDRDVESFLAVKKKRDVWTD